MHVVYGHGGDAVRAALAKENLQWALQAEQLGTGHAVMQAMPKVADDELVLVLYGDVPLIRAETLRQLIDAAGPKAMSLLTVMLQDPAGYGRIVRNARGAIQKIVEQKDASKAQLKIREGNSGIMAVPAKLLRKWLGKLKNANSQGEYYLTDVIAMAVKDKVKVTPLIAPTVAEVLGVNDKAQLAELEALHRADRARELMIAGATLADPARIDVRGEVSLGRDVFLDANVLLEGKVTLGDRVRIGPNTVLRDVSIGADTVVHPNSVLEQSELGTGCIIGPFARVRPGSKLGAGVHIGNFVELKKTQIDDGSKANHLTYLGDAVIGKGVNVGAGTITCNYDGVNKSTTTIDDGAFIGSGNMLVAPVRIGKGATTGAGSTITKDAPEGQLTLTRSKQMTLEGWKRPEKKPK
jgi:bifunctional UDP-N-acetylglucosamine pyrophosphorylase/glucosamine-1-phosphate N-acetyltransferase